MKIRILAGVAAAALVAGGLSIGVTAAPGKGGSKPSVAKPQLGTYGVDTDGMDKSVTPGNDFFRYVNGGWVDRTEIPADRANWGGFQILRNLSDERTRAIIEDVSKTKNKPGSVSQKVGDFFASFMDEAAIEKAGIDPVKPMLDTVSKITTPAQLAQMFGDANRLNIDLPISMGVQQDLKNNTIYSAYIGQGGLGMPDRDYYLKDDNPRYLDARAKYKTYVVSLLTLAGFSDPEARATRIYDLEKTIAQSHWTVAERRQAEKNYNPVATPDLGTKMPGFDWATYMRATGINGQSQLIIANPSAITEAAKLTASAPLETWRDYLSVRILNDAAPFLSKAFVDANFEYAGKTLSGTPKNKDRWKRGVDVINGTLGEAVGQIYVTRHFPPASKAKADVLVRNLTSAMDARLQKLEWMSPETKVKAREKLASFRPKIGYPDKWRDYSALEVKPGDAFGNLLRATAFEYNRQLAKIGKPVDRAEWFMNPQTVNAYANPLMNEVVFPAAILQAPFFDPNADPAVNYGGIGAVIGHEISHHFDDQGRKFDPKGNLSEWWTPEDIKRFDALTAKVVAQYGEYEPLKGVKVNGQLTLGENMADLAGITIAYDAYKLSLKGKPAPIIDGLTGDQRFFLGFGQIWRSKYRDAALQRQLATDPHTAGHFRPYVVRNIDAWYDAFGAKPGEKFYLSPAERVRVW